MIQHSTLWRFFVCQVLLFSVTSFNMLSAQTGPNDDFDGDGIINSIDIDDDNDGVPDAVESPNCFYSASEWNTIAKPTTNGVTITSALTTTLGNFGQLLDNVSATTAVTFTAGQPIQNINVYLFTFAQPVRLDALYLKFNITTQFANTTKIQGSNTNNGSDWVDLSAGVSQTPGTNITANGLVELTNSIKYPVTLNASTAYKYIRITGVVASNIAAQNASEVYFDFNVANYVASYYPKATCTDANIDGDGILPHFDLDSDGDGCSDAYEAGATTNLATNYKFTGAVGVNGLDNTLETSDNGIVNYTSTYYVYAQNNAMQICKDTDGDGILDINDIDDDNDGVLDTAEQVLETCSGVFNIDSRVVWNPTFTNSNTTATGNATVNGTPVSVTATTTKVFNGLKDDHWHFGSGTYVGCPDVTTVVSNSVINIFSNDYTVTYTFSRPVRNPSLSFSSFNGTAVLFPHPVYVSGLQGAVSGVSSNSYITSFPATENTVAVIYNGVFNSISFRVAGSDNQGSVLLNIPYVLDAGSLTYTLTSGSPFGYLDIDTDGDGIVNRLDLDSDGDGCPDAREAGVSSNAGASASMSASGGAIYTGGIPSGTANAYVGNGTPSQYGANGFFNGVETVAESGVYNDTYTYSTFALTNTLNLCTDTDSDGVADFIDIDDDNDGVVDAVESPACYYTASEWNTGAKPFYGVTISSALTTTTGNFSQLIDGVSGTTAVAFSASPTQAIQNTNAYLFNFAQPVRLDALYLQFNTATQFGGTTKIQGSNTNNGSDWVDLSAAIAQTAGTNVTTNGAVSVTTSIKYPVTLNTTTAYKYIRITGVAASNIVAANASEVYFDFNNAAYVSSSYPKAITCSNDPDNDTIPNHLDLDSDGDGCTDAREAGVSSNPAAAAVMSTSGGSIYTGGTPAGTPNAYVGNGTPSQYGANGFYNDIETGGNGIYNGTYTYQYAIGSNINICADSDGDGVSDFIDIDDDNDGVPDAVESPACYYTASEWNTGAKPFYGVTISSALTTTTANFSQLIDGVSGTTAVAFSATPAQPIQNANVYLFNFAQPVKLDALYLKFTTSTQFSGTTKIQGSNTNNGTDWVDLSASVAAGGVTNVTANGSVSVTTSVKYPVTLNTATAYKYIRITGVAASNIIAQNASEVYFDFNNATYVGSRYPKSTCTDANIDGDGIPPHLDLDSDGDGCSDALESGATTITTANYQFPDIDTNNDGLVDAVDANGDGIVDYLLIYTGVATDASINACLDTDGDGIRDIFDIDDDNDGVTDELECGIINTGSGCDAFSQLHQYVKWNTYDSASGTFAGIIQFPDRTVTVTLQASNTTSAGISGANRIDSIPTKVCPTPTASNNTSANSPFLVSAGTYTVTFSEPMYQPNFHFWSLGSSAVHPTATFNTDIQYVSGNGIISTTEFMVDEALDQVYSTAGKYAEGTGKILSGSITSFTFTTDISESNWSFFVSGIPTVTHLQIANCNTDTDGDGIPNRLDLDSDGDGCPDARETGVSSNAGASASMSASGGSIYSGGIPSGTANAYVGNGTPSQYGTNGLFNGIETTTDSGIYNSTYTYNYALANNINLCADTDGDSISDFLDIDDDNDGVVDATESPVCFYTANEWNTGAKPFYGVTISSALTTTTANFSQLIDGVSGTTAVAFSATPAQPIQNANVYLFNFAQPIRLDALYLKFNTATQFAGTTKIQGSNTNNGSDWVDLSAAISQTAATNTTVNGAVSVTISIKYPVTLNTTTAYKYIRITGVAASNIAAQNASEVYFDFNNAAYVASRYPKANCSNDPDGDLLPNHLDLDSDGDGCSDAFESGVSVNAGAAGFMSTSGGSIYTGGIPSGTSNAYIGNGTPSQYGTDGFFNGIETAADSGFYNGTYTYANAINAAINACGGACYKPAITAGTVLDTNHGITSLQRAGSDNDNWPMVRKGAWTALESKTKGFVPNRLTITQINAIPAANLREGMMVYNISSDCLYINTDGTATGWKCFNTQTCP